MVQTPTVPKQTKHVDGFQVNGEQGNIVITENTIIMPIEDGGNAAIILSSTPNATPINFAYNVLVQNNLLGGGNNTIITDALDNELTLTGNSFMSNEAWYNWPTEGIHRFGIVHENGGTIINGGGNVWYDGPNQGQQAWP